MAVVESGNNEAKDPGKIQSLGRAHIIPGSQGLP